MQEYIAQRLMVIKIKHTRELGRVFTIPPVCFDSKSKKGSQSHSVRAPVPIIESGAFGMQQQQVNTMQSGDNAQLAEPVTPAAQRHFNRKAPATLALTLT